MTVGYLADSFDLINVRDLDLISQASGLCSRLVVGVFTDDYAEQLFGRRPVVPFAERVALVSHVRRVAEVVSHDGADAGEAARVYVVFGISDQPAFRSASMTVLAPRRQTSSQILRAALHALDDVAVA